MISLFLSLIDNEDDRSKLEKIYLDYADLMKKTAFYITQDEYYAELAVSDTLLKFTDIIKDIRTSNEIELKAFIAQVTRNTAKNILREKNKTDRLLELDESKLSNEDIAAAIEADEGYAKILKIIHSQPEIYRDVLSLYYVHGYSLNDISNLLDRSYETVKKQLARGTATLRYILSNEVTR